MSEKDTKEKQQHKRCTKCGEVRPVEEFHLYYHKKQKKHYRKSHCKECVRRDQRERWWKAKNEAGDQEQQKRCTMCKEVKPIEAFYRYYHGLREKHYYTSKCRECHNWRPEPETKYCARCGHDKPIEEFYRYYDSYRKFYRRRGSCRECTKERQRWRDSPQYNTNPEPRVRAWLQELIEEVREVSKEEL